MGFPRLYVAASLKRGSTVPDTTTRTGFSAALCRGLIEAPWCSRSGWCRAPAFSAALCRGLIEAQPERFKAPPGHRRFPRLYVAASLKPA